MSRFAVAAISLWAAIGFLSVPQSRADDACAGGCVSEASTCVHSARAEKRACRQECRGQDEAGACRRGCRDAFRSGRAACREAMPVCASTCDDPTSPASSVACRGECGAALGQCSRETATSIPECIQGCDPGRGRGDCVGGCLDLARTGSANCREDYVDCVAACGGATTTTTTLPPPPGCESSAAPTCGGACPEAALSCVEIEPGVCGCVGGSPSAAFVRP